MTESRNSVDSMSLAGGTQRPFEIVSKRSEKISKRCTETVSFGSLLIFCYTLFMYSLPKLTTFHNEPVIFIESTIVNEGVICDVYSFINDPTKDLGIVTVKAGLTTPMQKVLKGDKTIEGFIEGAGSLTITNQDGVSSVYNFDTESLIKEIVAEVGQTMQWQANKSIDLVFCEVCWPPFTPDRFKIVQ